MSKEAALANGKAAVEGVGEGEGLQSRWKNNSEAGWVVQKFGGTSVGKFAVNIAEDIVRYVSGLGSFPILVEKGTFEEGG
jgi:aspartate kinase